MIKFRTLTFALITAATAAACGAPSTPDASTSTPAEPEASAADSDLGIGSTVEAGGRTVTVSGIERMDGLQSSNEFMEPVEGDIVLVKMTTGNSSNKSGNFAFSQFQLTDSQGRTYEEVTDFGYTMWRDEQGFGARSDDYFPGEEKADAAAFRVAPDAEGFALEWKGKTISLD